MLEAAHSVGKFEVEGEGSVALTEYAVGEPGGAVEDQEVGLCEVPYIGGFECDSRTGGEHSDRRYDLAG